MKLIYQQLGRFALWILKDRITIYTVEEILTSEQIGLSRVDLRGEVDLRLQQKLIHHLWLTQSISFSQGIERGLEKHKATIIVIKP